jgi:succinoglycan biosynthesis transport protein ExoP
MTLRESLRIIWSRRLAVAAVLLVGAVAAFAGWKLAKPSFSATASVMMNAGESQGTSIASGGFLGTDMPALLLSDTVLSKFIRQEHLEGTTLKVLRKGIDAEILPESGVMPITYRASTRAAAIAGVNMLADDLHAYYREIATRRYDDLAGYLSSAIAGERAKIEDADRKLQVLVAGDPYFTQQEASQAIGAQLLALNQQRDAVNATLQSHAIEAAMAGRRIADLMPTVRSELRANDPNYAALSTQVAKDKAAETVLNAQFTQQYAGIQSLQDQIARSNGVLESERKRVENEDPGNSATYGQLLRDRDGADATLAADRGQLAAIDAQIDEVETHLAKLPGIGVRVAALRQDRDAANTAYQILAEQRTLTLSQQAQDAALSSVTIVDRASVADAAVGKAQLLIPIAALLGFVVLALALPFGLELVDERLHRRVTIESLYGRPLIGTVPV